MNCAIKHFLKATPFDEALALTRAALLVQGFGIPVVEAFATGCPVAAADTSSIPEVAGDAAVLFDPASAETIAAAVDSLLADPHRYVARGLARAQQFTWTASAEAHIAVYNELA